MNCSPLKKSLPDRLHDTGAMQMATGGCQEISARTSLVRQNKDQCLHRAWVHISYFPRQQSESFPSIRAKKYWRIHSFRAGSLVLIGFGEVIALWRDGRRDDRGRTFRGLLEDARDIVAWMLAILQQDGDPAQPLRYVAIRDLAHKPACDRVDAVPCDVMVKVRGNGSDIWIPMRGEVQRPPAPDAQGRILRFKFAPNDFIHGNSFSGC